MMTTQTNDKRMLSRAHSAKNCYNWWGGALTVSSSGMFNSTKNLLGGRQSRMRPMSSGKAGLKKSEHILKEMGVTPKRSTRNPQGRQAGSIF